MNIIQTVKSILLKLIDDHVAVDSLLNPNPSPDDVGDILNVDEMKLVLALCVTLYFKLILPLY